MIPSLASTLLSLMVAFSGVAPAGAASQDPTAAAEVVALAAGSRYRRELKDGESQFHELEARAGQFVRVLAEQQNLDVTVSVFDPAGAQVAIADSPNGRFGQESASFVAAASGRYRVEVRGPKKYSAPGAYELSVEVSAAPTATDLRRVEAERLLGEALALRREGKPESLLRAFDKYTAAAGIWRELREGSLEGWTILAAGWTQQNMGKEQKARELYQRALKLQQAAGEQRGAAAAMFETARSCSRLKQRNQALDWYNKALALYDALGDEIREALVLNNIGTLYSDSKEKRRALDFYQRSWEVKKATGDLSAGVTLRNIASVNFDLGNKEAAMSYYLQALPVLQAAGDRYWEARTLRSLGGLNWERKEYQKALEYYTQSLEVYEALRDLASTAALYNNLGDVLLALGRKAEALDYYHQALRAAQEANDKGQTDRAHNALDALQPEGEGGADGEASATAATQVTPGRTVEAAFEEGSTHTYRLDLRAGELVEVSALQRGTDISLTLLDEAGERLVEADFVARLHSPVPEGMHYVVETAGTHLIEVKRLDEMVPARYALTVTVKAAASPADRTRIRAEAALAQCMKLKIEGTSASREQALVKCRESLSLWRELNDVAWEARALNYLGNVIDSLGRTAEALPVYHDALARRRAAGDRHGEAITLGNIGLMHGKLGERERNVEFYRQAFAIYQTLSDAREAAEMLLRISDVYLGQKEFEKQAEYCRQGAAVAREGGDAGSEGRAFRCLGDAAARAGRWPQAEEHFAAAVLLLGKARDWTFLSRAHRQLGQAQAEQGKNAAADTSLREALRLAEEHGSSVEAAHAHEALGNLNQKRGDTAEALYCYRQALRLWNRQGLKAAADRTAGLVNELSTRLSRETDAQTPTLSRPQLSTQVGHSATVLAARYSPDGKLLASVGEDDVIRIWDAATGQELRALAGHSESVMDVAFSPTDRLLVSAAGDRTIRVWDMETGQELQPFLGHIRPVLSVAFSPDGKTLASASDGDTFRVWDVQTRKQKYIVTAHDDEVYQVTFNHDGTLIATAGEDKTVKVWEAATGRLVKAFNRLGPMRTVAFSPDGKTLAAGCQDKKIYLWAVESWREIGQLRDHTGAVMSVAFAPAGRTLLSAGEEGAVKLWDVQTANVLRTYAGHEGSVRSVAFGAGGKSFASASEDETVKLWDIERETATRTLGGRQTSSSSLAYSTDRRWLAQAVGSQIVLWDLKGGASVGTFRGHRGQVMSLAFSPDGRLLASASLDGTAKLWDVSTMKVVHNLTRHSKEVNRVAFSPNGRTLVTVSDDRRIKLWNVDNGSERKSLLNESKVQAVAYSPDGRWFATGDVGGTFSLWDSTNYARWRSPEGKESVTTIAFSPDNKTMATGGGDGIVRLWDVEGRRLLYTCVGHGDIIVSLSYSPDGRVLASGSDDGTVILWEAEGGRKLRSLVGHTSVVHEVAFSPDGRTLASSGFDGSTRLWDPESGQVRATLVVTDVSGNWLVVMPNGLFDGSSAAWPQLLWRFSPRLYDVKTVEVFFNDFFRPGLLTDVANVRPPAAPREIQDIDRRQPTVSITTAGRPPEEGEVAAEKTVAVSVEVAEAPPGEGYPDAGSGARDVRLFRNGLLVKVWRGDALGGSSGCKPLGQGRARCEVRVAVVAGENRFTAYAFNRQNVKSDDAGDVWDGGAADSSRQSTLYILAVGINRYRNKDFNLKYAVPDAEDFGAELNLSQKGLGQFQRREVIPLYDEKASREGIVNALNSLKDRVQPEDTVAIYFAGHGVAYDNHFILVPHDLGYAGKQDDLDEQGLGLIRQHGISDSDLGTILEELNPGRLLMVIDACQSGQALKSDEWRQGPMNSKGLAQLAYEKGMYVLTASQSFQAAHGSGKFGHGYLTYALVEEGLKGLAADSAPQDGRVVLREWFDYATARVPKIRQDATERRELVHTSSRRGALNPRDAQHPRVFYRRELEATPFVVVEGARSAAGAPVDAGRDAGRAEP